MPSNRLLALGSLTKIRLVSEMGALSRGCYTREILDPGNFN